MKNRIFKLIPSGLAALVPLSIVAGGIQLLGPSLAIGAPVTDIARTAECAAETIDDGTGAFEDGDVPDSGAGPSSKDETPQTDEAPEPPFGGCIFDRKPLQLMV